MHTASRITSAAARWSLTLGVSLLGLLAVTFVIGRLVPIDPVLAVLGDRASASAYAETKILLGLDQPLYVQFGIYLRDVFSGNLGTSLLTARPVLDDIFRVFPATLELATIATVAGCLVGIPLGVAAAVYHNRWIDHLSRIIGLLGSSVPVFWLALMGLLLFYAKLSWVAGPVRASTMPSKTGSSRPGPATQDSLA
jgi:peptide/nickel transport system permease protein